MPSEEEKSESAYSETEGSVDIGEVKEVGEDAQNSFIEPNQSTGQSENDTESTQSTFSYDQLKAKSDNPVTGIDFKRREVGSYFAFNILTSFSIIWCLKSHTIWSHRPISRTKSFRPFSRLQRKASISCRSGSKTCRRRNSISSETWNLLRRFDCGFLFAFLFVFCILTCSHPFILIKPSLLGICGFF